MKTLLKIIGLVVLSTIFFVTCKKQESIKGNEQMTLSQKIARFTSTDISADISKLSSGDKKALDKIIEAARLMDPIYLRQVWLGNVELLKKLETDTTTAGKERLHYFRINMGPWSLLDTNESFIEDAPQKKPVGANYYPEDMTKEEFNKWIAALSEKEREQAIGFFSTIHRNPDRTLQIVPYSKEYREWLKPTSRLLKDAAGLTEN